MDKKQIRDINGAFDSGTINKRILQWWFQKVKGVALKMMLKMPSMTSSVGDPQSSIPSV